MFENLGDHPSKLKVSMSHELAYKVHSLYAHFHTESHALRASLKIRRPHFVLTMLLGMSPCWLIGDSWPNDEVDWASIGGSFLVRFRGFVRLVHCLGIPDF